MKPRDGSDSDELGGICSAASVPATTRSSRGNILDMTND